jgi:hypothetical protein
MSVRMPKSYWDKEYKERVPEEDIERVLHDVLHKSKEEISEELYDHIGYLIATFGLGEVLMELSEKISMDLILQPAKCHTDDQGNHVRLPPDDLVKLNSLLDDNGFYASVGWDLFGNVQIGLTANAFQRFMRTALYTILEHTEIKKENYRTPDGEIRDPQFPKSDTLYSELMWCDGGNYLASWPNHICRLAAKVTEFASWEGDDPKYELQTSIMMIIPAEHVEKFTNLVEKCFAD